jgi:hypothetical protein
MQLTQLEFSWGLRWGALNVNTHLNVFRHECRILCRAFLEILTFTCPLVRRDVQTFFDKGWLVLLPEEDIVQKYVNGGKPDFNGDVRDSILFCSKCMC